MTNITTIFPHQFHNHVPRNNPAHPPMNSATHPLGNKHCFLSTWKCHYPSIRIHLPGNRATHPPGNSTTHPPRKSATHPQGNSTTHPPVSKLDESTHISTNSQLPFTHAKLLNGNFYHRNTHL